MKVWETNTIWKNFYLKKCNGILTFLWFSYLNTCKNELFIIGPIEIKFSVYILSELTTKFTKYFSNRICGMSWKIYERSTMIVGKSKTFCSNVTFWLSQKLAKNQWRSPYRITKDWSNCFESLREHFGLGPVKIGPLLILHHSKVSEKIFGPLMSTYIFFPTFKFILNFFFGKGSYADIIFYQNIFVSLQSSSL